MINKADILVNDLLKKLNDIGIEDDKAIKCAILYTNQQLMDNKSTQKQILYNDMLCRLKDVDYIKPNFDLSLIKDNEFKITNIEIDKYGFMKCISIDKDIRGGRPCVKDTRITVMDVLNYISKGMTYDEIINDYPELTKDNILCCVEYANNILNKLFELLKNNKI